MSVDPAVASTNQPYVFTNDNPLNAEDPLGLKGSPGTVCIDMSAKACNAQEKATVARLGKGGSLLSVLNSLVKEIGKHVGDIGTAIAIGALFVPGLDLADLAVVSSLALGSRVAQRSINDGSAPWSKQNFGRNLVDTIATAGAFWLVGVSSIGASGAISSMSSQAANLVRLRLAFPGIFGLGLGFLKGSTAK